MHFLLIGASGRTGKEIVSFALSHNHTITALVRNTSSLNKQAGLSITEGSPLKQEDIAAAITSSPVKPDAIIVALSSLRSSDSPFSKPVSPPRLMTDSNAHAIVAMKKAGIKRIVTVSAFGVGDSNSNVFFPVRMILNHSNLAFGFEDHNAVEGLMRGTVGDIEWTLVRPVMLKEGPAKDTQVFGEQGQGVSRLASISRASVAKFVIAECLEKSEWLRQTPVIANV